MVRRVFSHMPGAMGLALAAVVIMGLAVPASALACPGHNHRPAPKYLVSASNYAPVAGTAVTISARLTTPCWWPFFTSHVKVTWSKTGAGGSFSSATSTTNSHGIATVTFTTGTTAGTHYTVTATDGWRRTGTSPTITTIAGAAAHIALNAGNNQSATAGTPVSTLPSVIVTDAHGNPVPGVSVTFAVASGGGSVTGSSATTNSAGIAMVGSWTLGASAGANTLTATSGTLSGSPVNFTATATTGPATQIALNAGDGQSATAGTAVSAPPSVIVTDAHGNPVSGASVTFTVVSGGGSVTGSPATTNAAGIATVGSWTLGATAGANTLTATNGSLSGSPVTFHATGTAGPAAQIALNAGDNQSATAGTAVSTTPSVIVEDTNNNPVSGVSVTFTVASGGGSVTGSPATTDAAGIATVGGWTLGASAGANTLTAASDSLNGSPVTFHATGTVGDATQIALNHGDGQSASAGTVVGTPPSVIVTDTNNNPVAGVSVTFTVASGGGSVSGSPATTNAAGIATVGSWTLGATAGANTLTATNGSLSGSPVAFTATGNAGVLQVQYNGTPVRAYSMAELQALSPFTGSAGFRKSTGTIVGPDAVTGVKITDVVADALGTPLTTAESVAVAAVPPASAYNKTFSYDRLVNFTGFTMYDASANTPVAISSLTGPLAVSLIYSDPLGRVMAAGSGPLRSVIVDAASENVVMSPSSDSVSNANQLNVTGP